MENNTIEIRNFGPIRESKLDISKSIILIGDNSTGKSFTSLLLHSLLNIYIGEFDLYILSIEVYEKLIKNNPDLLIKYSDKFSIDMDPIVIPKKEFEELINDGILEYYKELVEKKIKNTFNVIDLDELIKVDTNQFKITYNGMEFIKERNKEFKIRNFHESINVAEFFNVGNRDIFVIKRNSAGDYNVLINYIAYPVSDISFKTLYSHITLKVFNYLNMNNSFFIPSGRDELLKNKNTTISQYLKDKLTLSSMQKELAANILKITNKSSSAEFYNIARNLEEDILGGEIVVEYVNYNIEFYFINYENNIKLPFKLTSSKVRELASLILYLKYILKEGDVLFIEEIEAHLHPSNQVKLVKYLVELMNKGLKIIFTTHSDFILDQFNNYIRLSNVSKEKIKEKLNNYTFSDSLNPNKISIYKFILENSFNSYSKEVCINETGFDEDTFAEVSSNLYDESVKIIESKSSW